MHRYNVTVHPNAYNITAPCDLPLSRIISEFALPIDETADFEEMTFRQGDRTITLTRRDPEPQTAQVLLTYKLGEDAEGARLRLDKELRWILTDGTALFRNQPHSAELIAAELLPASPDVPAAEDAFRAACEREYEERPAIDHLNNLLAWMGATGAYTESSVIGENMRACSILLTDLRAALDRAQGQSLPGTER